MMFGRIAFMELKTAWKSLLLFSLLILFISACMPLIFPTYRDSLIEELEGANKVHLELPSEQGGIITLSWEPMETATSYMVLEDTRSSMVTPNIRYMGSETSITFEKDFEEKRYYAVMAQMNETSDPVLIGITATEKGEDPFQELLKNPAYSGLTGGRTISMLEVTGFVGLEYYSWSWMLSGLFIAYLSVSIIAGDFENKRMDVIFSAPISRRRYILEKFTAMSLIALLIVFTQSAGLIYGLASINALSEFSANAALLSMIGSLPFLLVIAAIGLVTAVLFQKVRTGMGITFAFVFSEFFLYTFGGFSKSLESMKTVSIFKYWDYFSVIIDNLFKVEDFLILTMLAIALVIVTIRIFQKKDIPT